MTTDPFISQAVLENAVLLISELIQREFSHNWNVIEGHHFSHYKQASLIGNICLRQLWDVCLTLILEYILIWMLIAAKPDRKAYRLILHRITESLQLTVHVNQIIITFRPITRDLSSSNAFRPTTVWSWLLM